MVYSVMPRDWAVNQDIPDTNLVSAMSLPCNLRQATLSSLPAPPPKKNLKYGDNNTYLPNRVMVRLTIGCGKRFEHWRGYVNTKYYHCDEVIGWNCTLVANSTGKFSCVYHRQNLWTFVLLSWILRVGQKVHHYRGLSDSRVTHLGSLLQSSDLIEQETLPDLLAPQLPLLGSLKAVMEGS